MAWNNLILLDKIWMVEPNAWLKKWKKTLGWVQIFFFIFTNTKTYERRKIFQRTYSINDKFNEQHQKRYIASNYWCCQLRIAISLISTLSRSGHLRKKMEELAKKNVHEVSGSDTRPLPYYRASYEESDWKDPWMRSTTGSLLFRLFRQQFHVKRFY